MEVVDTGSLAVQRVWAPVDTTDTYYVGQLVTWHQGAFDGVSVIGAAGANPDATANLCGIIEAIDTLEPLTKSDTTNSGSYVVGVETAAAQNARQVAPTTDKGPWVHGDRQVLVKIALITPWTKVMVPIFNAAFGTAPTELINTVADATGVSGTVTQACDFTPVANEASMYCRQGDSKGIMRITSDTSTTTPTNTKAFAGGTAVGDTFVRVPYRVFGNCSVVMDAENLYFNCAATGASNNFHFNVLELNLQNAGEEHVIGFFAVRHFDTLT